MATGKKYGLSDFQWIAVVISATLGTGIMFLPRSVGDTAGRDGWISIIIAGIAVWCFALLIWLLCRRFPTKTLPEFSIVILGRPLGILVSILYSLYAFAICGVVLRILSDLVRTWVFLWTPVPVFLVATLIAVGYTSRMGAVTLGRLTEIITLFTAVVWLMFLIPLPEFSFLNLRPIGSEGFLKILQAVPKTSFVFLGFEVMLVFFPFIINREKVLKLTSISLALVTALYAMDVILVVGVLGIERTLNLVWPLMNYMRIGSLPFVQRVDNILLFAWTAQIIVTVVVHYFSATFTLATLTRRRYHDIWSVLCLPLVYIAAILPQDLVAVFAFSDMVGAAGFTICLGTTALMLLVALIRGLDERRELKE
jgi:spore germination protein (amino acid permease)